jgi:hypothetical protein
VVRLIWVGVSLFAGAGVILYIIAGFLMPKADPMERDLKDVIHPEESGEDKEA